MLSVLAAYVYELYTCSVHRVQKGLDPLEIELWICGWFLSSVKMVYYCNCLFNLYFCFPNIKKRHPGHQAIGLFF